MKNETAFWNRVRDAFHETPRQRLRRFTDSLTPGAPDGLYTAGGVTGVLELKHLEDWPKLPDTPVRIGKGGLSTEQRRWLADWEACGGRAHVLFGVGKEWFLLRVHEIPEGSRMTRLQLEGVRRDGRSGTMRELKGLGAMLAKQLEPMV